ncbi:TetR/AcrR family transcriptional regulator [Fodinicola feengrottensis]|uniref:TetR/AcrR family transcriptional regulator n=1 Tax=Fodinicola feengrottensis TaxID=435914 RepID=A0ABP4VDW6_9ACTN
MRTDAQRNRAKVLAAAEVVLARDGTAGSMRAVAQEAGVGLGTIYRHFPTQEALYQAIVSERTRDLIDEAEPLMSATDSAAAFFDFFARIIKHSAEKKALYEVIRAAGLDPTVDMDHVVRDMRNAIEKLLTRAQEAGTIRQSLRIPEVFALMTATARGAESDSWNDELRSRTLAVIFDGMRQV